MRSRWVALGLLTAVLLVTGCSSSDGGSDEGPRGLHARLAAAKTRFDGADFIGFTMSAESLPSGVNGLSKAVGTGTHAPAFTGEVVVHTPSDITAQLVAVGGTVYAQLPFVGWQQLDPADYGAPDPAALMDRQRGISSLFTATTNLRSGGESRDPDDPEVVLTDISGVLPGSRMRALFPSAGEGDFDVTYRLTGDDEVRQATIEGPFYAGHPDVRYTIALDLDAPAVRITAPL